MTALSMEMVGSTSRGVGPPSSSLLVLAGLRAGSQGREELATEMRTLRAAATEGGSRGTVRKDRVGEEVGEGDEGEISGMEACAR